MTPKGFCKKYQTNGFVSPILAIPTTLSLSMDHICIFIFQSAWTFLGHFIYSLKSGSYFSLCLIFLPKNTHNKNVFFVKWSRRKNQAAFHISYKNISKKQLTYPYILHPFLAKMLQFIHDLAYFYDHHWPFQKPFLFLEREHQELTNCDMPCHLSVF